MASAGHRRMALCPASSMPPASAAGRLDGCCSCRGLTARRFVLRRSQWALRCDRRPLPLHARGVRPVRGVRNRVDALVHQGHELGRCHQRPRVCARLLPPVARFRLGAFDLHRARHPRDYRHQYQGHPPEQPGAERAHHRQAAAARHVRGHRNFSRSRAPVRISRPRWRISRRRACS